MMSVKMERVLDNLSSHYMPFTLLSKERLSEVVNIVRFVELREGDALDGPMEGGPFDIIAVTGSLPSEDALPNLQAQLNIGGRLFAVVGEDPVMEALLITRVGEREFRRESLFETSIPALANVPEPEHFTL